MIAGQVLVPDILVDFIGDFEELVFVLNAPGADVVIGFGF